MHGRNHTLAVSLSAFLMMGCASSPPEQPAATPDSSQSSIRPGTEMLFAKMVATVAAIGGNNPAPAYRTLSAQLKCRGSGAQPMTVAASCPRVATAK